MVVNLIEWSQKLLEAEEYKKGILPLTDKMKDLSIKEAYAIQLETINSKIALGEKVTGKKIGLTSIAMQKLLNVDEPDYGHLLTSMEVQDGVIQRDELIKPRVEAEIAFVMKESLKGPNVTIEQVLEATDYVVGSIEIVDSRVKDWKIKLQDTIADNASSAKYIIGSVKRQVTEVDLPTVQMKLYKNSQLINEGSGTDVLGNPANCVAWLINRLAEFNIGVEKGEVILSGALSAALDADEGDTFTADFGDLFGKIEVKFV